MLCWYKRIVDTLHKPEDILVEVIGTLDYNADNIITVDIVITGDSFNTKVPIYAHNPTYLSTEDHNIDDIYMRYKPKVNRLMKKYEGLEYSDLLRILKV